MVRLEHMEEFSFFLLSQWNGNSLDVPAGCPANHGEDLHCVPGPGLSVEFEL
jgi:hypothetical protein